MILELVQGKHFANETIYINGKNYEKCHFSNVVFLYWNDGPKDEEFNAVCRFDDCIFSNYTFEDVNGPPSLARETKAIEYNDDEWE